MNFLGDHSRDKLVTASLDFINPNKADGLITIIADNAGVCFQMKACEIRGQLNPTEERSSEAFNLSY